MKGNTRHRFFSISFSRKDRTFVFFFSERSPFAIRFLGKIASLVGLFIFNWIFSSVFYYRKGRRFDDFNIFYRWMYTCVWQACTWRKRSKEGWRKSALCRRKISSRQELIRKDWRCMSSSTKSTRNPVQPRKWWFNLRLSFWPLN